MNRLTPFGQSRSTKRGRLRGVTDAVEVLSPPQEARPRARSFPPARQACRGLRAFAIVPEASKVEVPAIGRHQLQAPRGASGRRHRLA
jgi:hypothetical protein